MRCPLARSYRLPVQTSNRVIKWRLHLCIMDSRRVLYAALSNLKVLGANHIQNRDCWRHFETLPLCDATTYERLPVVAVVAHVGQRS